MSTSIRIHPPRPAAAPFARVRWFRAGARRPLPLALEAVPAGFPSPAEDYTDKTLDLNELVVEHPAATFFVRAAGDSMRDAGVSSGDLLVVDRAVEPSPGRIVVAMTGGEFTVKRLAERGGRLWLMPANPAYAPVDVTEDESFEVWGVVVYAIRKL